MATLGFELCEEAHVQNTQQWDRQQQPSPSNRSQGRRFEPVPITEGTATTSQPVRVSAASRMREYLVRSGRGGHASSRSSLSSFRYSNRVNRSRRRSNNDDESTVTSHFSDDSGLSSRSTFSEQRRRKRKCAMRMMGVYICLAGTVFLGVILWRMGLIFKDVDDTVSAARDYTNTDGFDELGRMVCNGLTLNCHRRANEIMYATVHNAMSSREDSFLAYNNLLRLEDALLAGFRGLTIDSCDCKRVGIQLCHGLCLAGFRRPVETFTAIVEFMQQNAHEVVVIELEIGDESLGPLFDELVEVEGLFDLMYHHPGGEEKWPKLKDMIEMDKRLIVFAHDDVGCEEHGECPDGVLPTYHYAFATPFSQRSATALMDVDQTCTVNRGWSNSDFIISNHFATNDQGLPDINVARVTNAALNLQVRLDACQNKFSTKYGQEVINLLVVDFWNIGDTLDVVYKYNSALPAMTDAPSETPSSAPSLSPLPTITPSPTTVAGPTSDILSTAGPTSPPITSTPSRSPTTTAPSFPPTPATQSPSTSAPSVTPTFLSLESLFDSIMYEPESETMPPIVLSNFTAPITNSSVNDSMPTLGETMPLGSTPSTFGANVSTAPSPILIESGAPWATPAPTFAENISMTGAPTLAASESIAPTPSVVISTMSMTIEPTPFLTSTTTTMPPTLAEIQSPTTTTSVENASMTPSPTIGSTRTATTMPTIVKSTSPTFDANATMTPAPTVASDTSIITTTTLPTLSGSVAPPAVDSDTSNTTTLPTLAESIPPTMTPTVGSNDAFRTPAPTFGITTDDGESQSQNDVEKEQPEAAEALPEVEKEYPDDISNNDSLSLLSSAFGEETSDPTPEETTPATVKENESHSFFVVEKDPAP